LRKVNYMKKRNLLVIIPALVASLALTGAAGGCKKPDQNLRFEVYADDTGGKCNCNTGDLGADEHLQGEAQLLQVQYGTGGPGGHQYDTAHLVSTPWKQAKVVDGGRTTGYLHAQALDPAESLIAAIYKDNILLLACGGKGTVDCGTDLS